MKQQEFREKVATNLTANTFTAPDDTKGLLGWAMKADGEVVLTDGESYTATKDITLYAIWATRKLITFNANGGSDSMEDQSFFTERTTYIAKNTFSPPTGKPIFKGWTSDEAEKDKLIVDKTLDTYYGPEEKIKSTDNLHLYALWGDTYEVGDRGPAGGLIFYDIDADNEDDNADNLKSKYADAENGVEWRYFEAAPTNAVEENGNSVFEWGPNSDIITSKELGSGKNNTKLFIGKGNNDYTNNKTTPSLINAHDAADNYTITKDNITYDDWFLPSSEEFKQLIINLHNKGLANLTENDYWCSSTTSDNSNRVLFANFDYKYDIWNTSKYADYLVRPVRVF